MATGQRRWVAVGGGGCGAEGCWALESLVVASRTLWIGSYPPAGIGTSSGRGEGIYRSTIDLATGRLTFPELVVETPAPSFLALRPDAGVLYAVDEDESGQVTAFRVHDERLEPLGAVSSGGRFPCHLLVDGDRLYVANYGDGGLGVLPLAPDGSFATAAPQVLPGSGSGPDPERQRGPHAHFVARAPGGHVLVVDLGADRIRRYRRTTDGLEPAGTAATLPAGTGPRHLAFEGWFSYGDEQDGGRFAYVTGELDATVRVLAWDPATDTGELVQTLPATRVGPAAAPTAAIDGDPRAAWAADPAPSPSHLALAGSDLVVAVRGVGVLSRFAVGADWLLTHRADQPLPGPTPRHFAVVGGWTVVAEQVPGAVSVLGRDGSVVSSYQVPSAACVVPAP